MCNRKGFTLTELIAGMVIAAIIALAAGNIFSINAGLIKRSSYESGRNIELLGVAEHIASNVHRSAWMRLGMSELILYPQSSDTIRQYYFDSAKKTLYYYEGPTYRGIKHSGQKVLCKDIESSRFFWSYDRNTLKLSRYLVDLNSTGVRVNFWGKPAAGRTYKTVNVFYTERFLACPENPNLTYVDPASKFVYADLIGTKAVPASTANIVGGWSMGVRAESEKKVLFLSPGRYSGVSSLNIRSLYIMPGVNIDFNTGSMIQGIIASKDLHILGTSVSRVTMKVPDNGEAQLYMFNNGSALSGKNIIIDNIDAEKVGLYNLNSKGSNLAVINSTFSKCAILANAYLYANSIAFRGNNLTTSNIFCKADKCDVSQNSFINTEEYFHLASAPVEIRFGSFGNISNNTFQDAEVKISLAEGGKYYTKGNKFENSSLRLDGDGKNGFDVLIGNNLFSQSSLSIRDYQQSKKDAVIGNYTVANNTIISDGTLTANGIDFLYSHTPIKAEFYNNLIRKWEKSAFISAPFGSVITVTNNIFLDADYFKATYSYLGKPSEFKNNVFSGIKDITMGYYNVSLENNAFLNVGKMQFENLTVKNCIMWADPIYNNNITVVSKNKMVASYSSFMNIPTQYAVDSTVVSLEPVFIDPDNYDFGLQPGNPCKGKGEGGADLGAYGGPGAAGWEKGVGVQGQVGNVQ